MWVIEKKGSVGPLTIGMSLRDAVTLLGEYETFKRTPDEADNVYAFDAEHVHLSCDPGEHVKIISLFRPRSVVGNGVQLLGRNLDEVCNELSDKGIKVEAEDGGYWVESLATLLIEIDGIIDGIEVYQE